MAKEETPEVAPAAGGGNSPKYFDKVKQFLKSVVGEDKNKIVPLKKLALVIIVVVACVFLLFFFLLTRLKTNMNDM